MFALIKLFFIRDFAIIFKKITIAGYGQVQANMF